MFYNVMVSPGRYSIYECTGTYVSRPTVELWSYGGDGECWAQFDTRTQAQAAVVEYYTKVAKDALALVDKIHKEGLQIKTPPGGMIYGYGYCPTCGSPGVTRERRPNGNDTCSNGHTYPSKDGVIK